MTYPNEEQRQELNAVNGDSGAPAGWPIRIIAARADADLSAVPLADTRLPSLDTPHVLDWLALHKNSAIFVSPEARGESSAAALAQPEGESSLIVDVEPQEYEALVGLLPA
jgi:hypothetical protein